jgi:NADH-quinone oxidoreductase subunit G
LQDLGYEHGAEGTRYEFKRREFEKKDIGDYIQLHMTRCILCYRCVYTADQVSDNRCHGVLSRGDHAEIATYIEQNIKNDMIGNVIDVCPVGALTDKTFRFKHRVWFTKPVYAHRKCDNPKCCGEVTLWSRGANVLRVTARKNQWGEIQNSSEGKPGWICNTCRFDKKDMKDWTVEGPVTVSRHSVINQGHYSVLVKPQETFTKVMGGRDPKLLMDIHSVSEVNNK